MDSSSSISHRLTSISSFSPSAPAGDSSSMNIMDIFSPADQALLADVDIRNAAQKILSQPVSTAPIAWSTTLQMPVQARLTPDGATVLVSSVGSGITALDKETGKRVWSNSAVQGECGRTPLRDDGLLFVRDKTQLHAIDTKTGKDRWVTGIPGQQDNTGREDNLFLSPSGVLISGSKNQYNEKGNMLYGVNPDTGEVIWEHVFTEKRIYEAVPAGDILYTVTKKDDGTCTLLGLNMKDGTKALEEDISLNSDYNTMMADNSGNLFVADGTKIHAFDGKEKRTFDLGAGNKINSFSESYNDKIVLVYTDNRLNAVEKKTGHIQYTIDNVPWFNGALLGNDGTVFARRGLGGPYSGFDGTDGHYLWSFEPVNHAYMTVTDSGKVLMSESEHPNEKNKAYIYEVDPKSGAPTRKLSIDTKRYGTIDKVCMADANGDEMFVITSRGVTLLRSRNPEKKITDEPEEAIPETKPTIEQVDDYVIIDGIKIQVKPEQGRG